jgi:hypothetical protein
MAFGVTKPWPSEPGDGLAFCIHRYSMHHLTFDRTTETGEHSQAQIEA